MGEGEGEGEGEEEGEGEMCVMRVGGFRKERRRKRRVEYVLIDLRLLTSFEIVYFFAVLVLSNFALVDHVIGIHILITPQL